MRAASNHLYFSHSLARLSTRLDELIANVRREQSPLPAELLDEIAYTTGELMVVLMDYRAATQEDEFIEEALAHAQQLHRRLRSRPFSQAQVAESCDSFKHEIDQLIRQSRRVA
jgi:hypothetical protein